MKFTTISDAKKQTGLSYLGGINISSKLAKNMKVNVMTYCTYFAPADISGYDVCSHSTPECRLGCLNTSGRVKVESYSNKHIIENARIKRTKLLYEHREFFMQWLIAEITTAKRKAEKLNYIFSIRLNGTSDINWQMIKYDDLNIFDTFPLTPFYDYTKNHNKFNNTPINYHLTYSYTGKNWNECIKLMALGFNIAMVFNVKKETDLSQYYKGYSVINGDLNDYRIADANGIIVGLKWKRIANKENEKQVINSCFVIQPNDVNCKYINV